MVKFSFQLGRNPIPEEAGVAALELIEKSDELTLQQLDLGVTLSYQTSHFSLNTHGNSKVSKVYLLVILGGYDLTQFGYTLFQEILYGKTFKEKLMQVLEKHKEFECPFGYTDSYGKRKLKQYNVVEEALNAMKDYCVEHNINIVELFSRFDQDGSMSVTHEEFKEGLRVRNLTWYVQVGDDGWGAGLGCMWVTYASEDISGLYVGGWLWLKVGYLQFSICPAYAWMGNYG